MATIILTPLFLNGIQASGAPEGFVVDNITNRVASINPANPDGTLLFYTDGSRLGQRVYEVSESMTDIASATAGVTPTTAHEEFTFAVVADTAWSINHGLGRPMYWSFIDSADNDLTASITRLTDDGTTATFGSSVAVTGTVYYH